MSEEQIGRRQNRVSFKLIAQTWDYENSCSFCGCIFLSSASSSQRKLCCQLGKFMDSPEYPKLFELPMILKALALERIEHFSSRSSYYNNIFSIAVTGYDNGRPNVGCEQINGPGSLKMNGRSYHFFPTSASSKHGGIANFTYDGSFQVEQHGDFLNSKSREEKIVHIPFLKGKNPLIVNQFINKLL